MRKTEREIAEIDEILNIFERCGVCRVGIWDGNVPYIVPLNFGFERAADGTVALYFHSARAGRKLDLLRERPTVGFEMDCSHELLAAQTPCDCAMNYESVIGSGNMELISDDSEKRHCLDIIMRHYRAEEPFVYDEKAFAAAQTLKLTVTEMTCKRRR